MWFLTQIKTNKRFYLLHDKSRYLVSRNAEPGDLTLAGDTSISRLHASLHPNKDYVQLMDTGSKYGTFVNGNIDSNVPIEKHVSIELRLNDRIRFGRLENVWRLDKVDVVSLSSTLSVNEKKSLKADLTTINGTLVSEWTDRCTHLTVASITITLKVLQALSGTVPIVTPDFWKSYISAARSGSEMPKPEDFVPPVDEPYISNDVQFGINVERRRIFANKEFVFMQTKHMERYELVIRMAGGKCSRVDRKKKSSLIKPGVCVVQYNPSTQSQTTQDIDTITEYLRSMDRRSIPECEIGLAILHCSTVKFCNPQFRPDADFLMPSLKRTLSAVLAGETPKAQTEKNPIHIDVSVPETLTNSSESKPTISMEPIILLDDSMEVFSEKKTLNIPAKSSESCRRGQKRAATDQAEESLPKRPAVVEDFTNVSMQLLDEDNDLLDSISFDVEDIVASNNNLVTKPNSVPIVPLTRSIIHPTPINTSRDSQITNTSGFISRKSIPSQTTAKPTTNPQKRTFNLLSNDSDDEDDEGGALFKFDKNPVAIKRNKTTSARSNTTHTNDVNDSELFAFSSTASQKVSSQKAPTKATSHLPQATPGRPDSYMSRTLLGMQNLSIQPVAITLTGWLNTSIKTEKTEPLNHSDVKPDLNGSVDDSKDWINQIQNAFEVRVKKMQLVNRSTLDRSAMSNISNASVASNGKNFKTFTKKRNFQAQSTVLKTTAVNTTSLGPIDF